MTNEDVELQKGPRAAIERYFTGHVTGDPEVMRRAFHPEARLQWNRGEVFESAPLETYLTWLPGTPAEDEESRVREVTELHVSENVAAAEVVLDYPTVRFVDYLTIVRVDEDWRITNKTFQAYPKDDS